uniref:ATP synthase F0 subunit 6 n=1 Tax=Lepophidium profundorum TaxID=334371 RepID=UPI0028D2E331|nr:ATP synthase F0 subunit 6 [Lepophidium profundorum]WMY90752.1 ATP synthase F0 subunit 6 [Lepophidium profundorum]
MIVSLFDQFASPTLLAIPLVILALLLPWDLFPAPSSQWQGNRLVALLSWLFKTLAQQIVLPANVKGHKWALMLLSLLILLITLNMMGTLPYTFTPTTQLSVSLGLAFPLWLATVIIGMRLYPLRSIAHLVPESTPAPLIPALIIIETISLLVRPLALGVRLAANLTAGHMILQMIASTTLGLLCSISPAGLLGAVILYLLVCLELMVAAIQAYVFVLLLSLYLQENV